MSKEFIAALDSGRMELVISYCGEKHKVVCEYNEKVAAECKDFDEKQADIVMSRNRMKERIDSVFYERRAEIKRETEKAKQNDDEVYCSMLKKRAANGGVSSPEELIERNNSAAALRTVQLDAKATLDKLSAAHDADVRRNQATYDFMLNQAKRKHNENLRSLNDEKENQLQELKRKLNSAMRMKEFEAQKGGAE